MNSGVSSDSEKKFSEREPTSRPFRWTWRRILFIAGLAILGAGILVIVITLPIVLTHRDRSSDDPIPNRPNDPTHPRLVLDNFPDPGLLQLNGTWYAFGTSPQTNVNSTRNPHIPIATSQDFIHWNLTGLDALPTVGAWENRENHYAPDAIQRDDGRFVLYYSGEVKNWTGGHHCVGAAISNGTNPLGPYQPQDRPLACPRNQGGAIDPSPFRDVDGTLYVTYKADANSVGHGGDCNNGKKPIVTVPIMLQQLKSDGVTTVGDPVEILTSDKSDGPLIEAPDIIRTEQGMYFLFFSSHCYTSSAYDIKFAWSQSLKGPYQRAPQSLLKTRDYGLRSPGGATVSRDGKKMVFHAYCGQVDRCMYVAAIDINLNETIAFTAI